MRPELPLLLTTFSIISWPNTSNFESFFGLAMRVLAPAGGCRGDDMKATEGALRCRYTSPRRIPMQAAVFHGPKRPLTIEEVPTPQAAHGEVLLKVAACGVCRAGPPHLHSTPPPKAPIR